MAERRAGTPCGWMADSRPLSSLVRTCRMSLAQVAKGKWAASTALVAKSYRGAAVPAVGGSSRRVVDGIGGAAGSRDETKKPRLGSERR